MEVNALRSQVEGMEARYPSLNFQYQDPERGFDRRKVITSSSRKAPPIRKIHPLPPLHSRKLFRNF